MSLQNFVVLGGGSAGLIAAITLKRTFPSIDVRLVRSREIGIIGVGEGTTPVFRAHFHDYLKIPYQEFHERAHPTWKIGLRLIWGPRGDFHFPFLPHMEMRQAGLSRNNAYYAERDFADANLFSALMKRNKAFPAGPDGKPVIDFETIAYHIENVHLVDYLEWRALADGIEIIDGTVGLVGREGDNVTFIELEGGERITADFFVDASGFRSKLLGETLEEPFISYADTLLCDRAVIAPREREPDEPIRPYTTAETMDHGWCWRIDHEHHVNRGYVYSSSFVSDEDAEAEFRRQNPKVGATRVVKFISGRYRRSWVGNVAAVGNATGFVEPLEATALGLLCTQARNLVVCLKETSLDPTPGVRQIYNNHIGKEWDDIRDFLSVHYRFNTLKDTPFWRHCRENTPLHNAQPLLDFYREIGPSSLAKHTVFPGLHAFGLDGYYVMFLGMKIPFARSIQAGPEEWLAWENYRAGWVKQARGGVTVREALDLIRSPNVTWPKAA